MKYYKEYTCHEYTIEGMKKCFDTTIYTFDIETSSYLILNNEQINAIDYLKLNEDEQEECMFYSTMYIWQLGINDEVYYGRTYDELLDFLKTIEQISPFKKYFFVHNLSFEFQYLINCLKFKDVFARKAHKVIKCELEDFNIEFRCTYMMTNVKLEKLPDIYNLPVKKQVGSLDYTKIRHSETKLTKKELKYAEYDCLVVYYYIKKELETYKTLNKIPITHTGHVRRELQELIMKDWSYKNKVRKSVNVNPHIYNLMLEGFMGGYTHANWIYTDEVIKNVRSFDFTSSYPYVMTTYKYPSNEFRPCKISKKEQMTKQFAYILVVRFTNIKCKYYNNFISQSKCRNISGARYDNGRIIQADSLEITLTDVDFYFILKTHKCKYEILECYYSKYDYLPIQFIKFILEKYVNKTKFKNVEGKEVEYALEKAKFNSLYGMSVTNNIRDEVIFDNETLWSEEELTNEQIIKELETEKNKAFLSFSYGVWVTAHARNNLLENVIKLDDYVIYCDTDSIKLVEGFDINVINNYNKEVDKRIEKTCELLEIDKEMFEPEDSKGIKHKMGVFDEEKPYQEFVTQGAKKYAYKQDDKIHITVAGVPKKGAKQLKDLNEFKDDFVFDYEFTGKQMLMYNDEQESFMLTDYLGQKYEVTDKHGICFVPATYTLGKSLEYAELIDDNSSSRAKFKE